MLDIESGKVTDFIKFDIGNLAMATGGHNNGRVGTIVHKEKHKGSFDIVHIEDAAGEGRLATWCLTADVAAVAMTTVQQWALHSLHWFCILRLL